VTSVSVDNPLRRRAVVIVGGRVGDPSYPAFELNGSLAVSALEQQGYGPDGTDCTAHQCDDIQFLTDAGLADTDGAPTLANIQQAIEVWGADDLPPGSPDGVADVQDLTIYIVGESEAGGIRLSGPDPMMPAEILTPTDLSNWLATAEGLIPGRMTVIIEADDAGNFVSQLTPAANRITVVSAGGGESAQFFRNGAISFSKFFWGLTLNGATVRQAFRVASQAIRTGPGSQTAELDDNGNGTPNELLDGLVSSRYSIGTGVLLAGDDPVIGAISAPAKIASRPVIVTVSGVTSTSSIDRADLVISRDDGTITEAPMNEQGGGVFTATLCVATHPDPNPILCPLVGTQSATVAAYAQDADGDVSLPVITELEGDLIFSQGFE
jgi:hypothetical protein